MRLLLSCSIVDERALLDIPKDLETACYTALPVACVQAKSIDVLKDLYELDLLRYVSWYCQRATHVYRYNVENLTTFFKWMERKVRLEVNAQLTLGR